jgi:hypothetical protein
VRHNNSYSNSVLTVKFRLFLFSVVSNGLTDDDDDDDNNDDVDDDDGVDGDDGDDGW